MKLKLLVLTIYFCCAASLPKAIADQRPNILFFLVDDMGIGDTSLPFLYSDGKPQRIPLNDLYRTPNMERLAASGRLFTNAYSYSVCSPTRISLMTGQSAPRHRVTTWTHPKESSIDTGLVKKGDLRSPPNWNISGIDRSLPLLPELAREAGYRTLFAGKAHFGPDDTLAGNPENLGFDVNIAGFGGGGPGSYWGKYDYSANHRTGKHVWDVPGLEKYHGTDMFLTEAITREMNLAIESAVESKQPFFAYMSHYAVHAPWLYPDNRFVNNYPTLDGQGLAFATLVEGMDKSLGDMLQKLEELGVAEETLVVFFSDNGSAWSSGGPFRDKKGSRFEGGVRVPLIVSWAKRNDAHPLQQALAIPQASVDHRLVTCVDMMPTLLGVCDAAIPEGVVIDGFDISPYFKGQRGLCRSQEFLVHFPHQHRNTLFSTYRKNDWKVIYSYATEEWELYNLANDPFEKENACDAKPQIALRLAREMLQRLDALQALFPVSEKTGASVKPILSELEEAVLNH